MPPARIALLPDRGVVHVTGEDAVKFLQGLVTNDISGPGAVQPKTLPAAVHAGLLTPQGKILFEFFVAGLGGGLLLDVASDRVADLVKRLTMYKLRAKAEVADASGDFAVVAAWGGPFAAGVNATHYGDPRLAAMGVRWLAPRSLLDRLVEGRVGAGEAELVDADAYRAHRVALGVPEGGKDYAFGDAFPHEANFDLLNGVSFSKGCFVGQEVVSRMQHRGGARKRIVIIEADAPLQSGAAITAGAASIGAIGSVADKTALALVRLDRAEEAQAKGEALTVAGTAIRLRLPAYFPPAPATVAQ